MTTKLIIWNQALIHLGSAPIASTTDTAIMAVNVFTNAWEGVVEEAFNEGDWNFAKRTSSLAASISGSASPGYTYVFDYPVNYLRTVSVSPDTRFMTPFNHYLDEQNLLHSNITPLFIRYVSNAYMTDFSGWPTMFWRYVAAKLAYETCERLTQGSTNQDKLQKLSEKALRKAKSIDAQNMQGTEINNSRWLQSMGGGRRTGSVSIGSGGGGDIVLSEGDI